MLQTRLGPLAWRSSGEGPALVFFAGALANGDLWRDVVAALEDRYRCITVDLPLGAHRWPLTAGADRSATSLARLLLDCLELLDVDDATVVANDTAGGLLLLSLAIDHPAHARIGRLVLSNCDSYEKFPPDALKTAVTLCRRLPRVARASIGLQARVPRARRKARRRRRRERVGPRPARRRSSRPRGAIAGWPETSSPPWPASARNCCSTPRRRSSATTARSC